MAFQQVIDESSSSECALQAVDPKQVSVVHAPIVSSFDAIIRPLLDCFDKIRPLNIMQEGIQLPTIVVIGDQSSGKSSVVESLTGISLPRGNGICTRVPLILRLQNHIETELHLEYNGKSVPTDEVHVAEAITCATNEIAGHGKGISNIPITLIVKKNGVPDLAMVDLPGITRVPVLGQPEDIFEQISGIIMEYITPEESIILNVLSASVDFTTCESFRMLKKVDITWERTLAVVTMVDKAPKGLLEKVTANGMNVGFGCVCIRNRIENESYEKALGEETSLFETHALLSKIDKSMVGVPVLANKLVQIQANNISKCLPDIVRKIDDKLAVNVAALNELPQHLGSVAVALASFMHIRKLAKKSLKKIFLGVKIEDTEDFEMQCAAKWSELLDLELKQYSAELRSMYPDNKEDTLFDELIFLKEARRIGLPLSEKEIGSSNFPSAIFLNVLQEKVRGISATTEEFVGKLWNYIEEVVIKVLMHHSCSHPELEMYFIRKAVQNLIARRKDELVDRVREIIGTDSLTDLTSNTKYVATFSRLMSQQKKFMKFLKYHKVSRKINLNGFGVINILLLRKQPKDVAQQAFELKMTLAAYWQIMFSPQTLGNHQIKVETVNEQMASLHMRFIAYWQIGFSLEKIVNYEFEEEILSDLIASHGGGFESSMQESFVAEMRFRLNKSVKLLEESKEVVTKIIDSLAHNVSQEKA